MSTIAVNQITDSSGLSAPVFPPGSAQLNPMASREDKIINGDFGIWQRGTSFATSAYGGADRWANIIVGGGTVTQSQQPFSPGDNLGTPGLNPTFFLRQTVSGQTLTSSVAYTVQRIEDVRSYAGQTITVLGWARRSSGATGNMVLEGIQGFGTGGAFDPPVSGISPTTVTLGSSWAPFAVVMNVPSIVTKTIGTDSNSSFQLAFWTSAGTDYAARTNSLGIQTIGVDLWGIHIRHGTWTAAATADYRPRDPSTELALCQRYLQVFGGGSVYERVALAQAYSTTSAMVTYTPTVTFRAAPACTYTGAWCLSNAGMGVVPITGFAMDNTTPRCVNIQFYATGGGLVAGHSCQLFTNNNLTARMYFNAEL